MERYAQQAKRSAIYKVDKERIKNDHLALNLRKVVDRKVNKSEERIRQIEKTIDRLNPETLLLRGYTKTEKDGLPIRGQALGIGDELVTYTKLKKITSVINKLEENEKQEG